MEESQGLATDLENGMWGRAPTEFLGFSVPPNLPSQNPERQSTLYFLRHAHLLKIGIAADLERRMQDYRRHNPTIGKPRFRAIPHCIARQVERTVHNALADYRREGEWFEVDEALAIATAKPIIGRSWRAVGAMSRAGWFRMCDVYQ
jgi:hypothetical protein